MGKWTSGRVRLTHLALQQKLSRHSKIGGGVAIKIADSGDILRDAKRLGDSEIAVLDERELAEGGDGLVALVCDHVAVSDVLVRNARLLQAEQRQEVSCLVD